MGVILISLLVFVVLVVGAAVFIALVVRSEEGPR